MQAFSAELKHAIVAHREGRLVEAEHAYRALLTHRVDGVHAHAGLGMLLANQGRLADARKHYAVVAQHSPNDFIAHKMLGDACSEAGEIEISVRHYRDAAACRPNEPLWSLRAEIVPPLAFSTTEQIEQYREQLLTTLQSYRGRSMSLDLDELAASGCKPPLALPYHGRDDRPLKEAFATIFADHLPAELPRGATGKPHVGFVVTAGNEGVFLRGMAGVLRQLDASQLRVTVVCATSAIEKCRQAIASEAIEWLPLAPRLSNTVEQLRDAQFDVLYFWEIGTDCTNYFLPFFRLAPLQCTSWGWPVTSGIAEVDYFLSCDSLEPAGADAHYTEKLLRFKHLPNCYDMPEQTTGFGGYTISFTGDYRVYFCGQNPRKFHPDFDRMIGDILRADSKGVVMLIESAKPAATAALKQRMAAANAGVADRIVWVNRVSQTQYNALLAAADCVLDTPHYCGGANTTYDAFAVAAPIVTLPGRFHRGRYTAAAYGLMGMDDCVAHTAEDYVRLAVRTAIDRDFHRSVVERITERREVLFGNRSAAVELQEFLLTAIAGR